MSTLNGKKKKAATAASGHQHHQQKQSGQQSGQYGVAVAADGLTLREYFDENVEQKLLEHLEGEESPLNQKTPASILLEKKQELQDTEHELLRLRNEVDSRMNALAQRKIELERREQQLQDNLKRFDRFLRENDKRKERALLKAREEDLVCVQREAEIDSLRAMLRRYQDTKARQQQIILRYQKYETFLKKTLALSGDFAEISDLIDRHATLVGTNKDLKEAEKKCLQAIDEAKKKMFLCRSDNKMFTYKCNNTVAELSIRKEESETKRHHWEHQFSNIQTVATKKTLLLGQIKLATSNLYHLIKKRGLDSDEDVSPEKQLEKIQNYLVDVQDITEQYETRGKLFFGNPGHDQTATQRSPTRKHDSSQHRV